MSEILTSLSIVYEAFLSKISDYNFLSDELTEDDIAEELLGYLKSAIAKFYKCKNDLTIQTNNLGEAEFVSQLTSFEIEILITLMIVEYLKPQVLSTEVLKQSLSDKSFKIYSQANQIRELSLLYRVFKKEANTLITEYTYLNLNKDDFYD